MLVCICRFSCRFCTKLVVIIIFYHIYCWPWPCIMVRGAKMAYFPNRMTRGSSYASRKGPKEMPFWYGEKFELLWRWHRQICVYGLVSCIYNLWSGRPYEEWSSQLKYSIRLFLLQINLWIVLGIRGWLDFGWWW
jgi:hypothetical protein